MARARPRRCSISSLIRAAACRNALSGCGAGWVLIPTFAICSKILCMLEVRSGVRQVERLVDQREVGNDVADHGVLERRPVLPRRIVRMAAAYPPVGVSLHGDEHLAAPAFDPADAECALPGFGQPGQRRCRWQGAEDFALQVERFERLLETHDDARRHVAVAMGAELRRELEESFESLDLQRKIL